MSDLFGSLGGLMKGLSNFMPADDPNTQLFKLQNEVSDLKKQEADLYAEIGKKAVEQYGTEAFGEIASRLTLIQANLSAAQDKLQTAQAEKEQRDAAEKAAKEQRQAEERAALAQRTCPECGEENPEGTKFCQQCGTKLGVKNLCPSCGHGNPNGIKYCQECGAKLGTDPAPTVCPECGKENEPGTRFCGGCGTRLEG